MAPLSTEFVRDGHCFSKPGHLARDRVELRASDNGQVAGPHAATETGDEVAAACDDQERALRGIVDRDRYALRAVRQLRRVEHGAEEIGIAVEFQGEIHLAAREAIEARQEVLGVLHVRLVPARTEGDKGRRAFAPAPHDGPSRWLEGEVCHPEACRRSSSPATKGPTRSRDPLRDERRELVAGQQIPRHFGAS